MTILLEDQNKVDGLPGGPRALGPQKQRSARPRLEASSKGEQPSTQVKAVMFVPYTPGSVLAKKLRENEEKMGKLTKNKIKIVERTGTKIQDILRPIHGKDKIAKEQTACCALRNKEQRKTRRKIATRETLYTKQDA